MSAPKDLMTTSGPSPALRLPDATGVTRELSVFRAKPAVLVFFKGIKCFHCVEQLRELVRQARGPLGPYAEIAAVSSVTVPDVSAAMKALEVSEGDRFHLLVDPSHCAFRDFGCYADGPQHGLFLFDRNGTIRASYTGESPLDNSREVVRRLRQLAADPVKVSSTP
jgi:peroxiredoxin